MTAIDRVAAAIPHGGISMKELRANLADLIPIQIDYAIQGLIKSGRYQMLDGVMRCASDAVGISAMMAAPAPRPPPNSDHPWKRLPFSRMGGG